MWMEERVGVDTSYAQPQQCGWRNAWALIHQARILAGAVPQNSGLFGDAELGLWEPPQAWCEHLRVFRRCEDRRRTVVWTAGASSAATGRTSTRPTFFDVMLNHPVTCPATLSAVPSSARLGNTTTRARRHPLAALSSRMRTCLPWARVTTLSLSMSSLLRKIVPFPTTSQTSPSFTSGAEVHAPMSSRANVAHWAMLGTTAPAFANIPAKPNDARSSSNGRSSTPSSPTSATFAGWCHVLLRCSFEAKCVDCGTTLESRSSGPW
mmetsp:Transcript_107751/g.303587  ORF Transcript_107751/g.303587 Transcript_107751/m.303587 type:complete len:265 (-) Transcript_107751:740-1534(-)